MDLDVDDETTWWVLKAGREGVLEDDWIVRNFVSTGWGKQGGDFRDIDPAAFRAQDESHNKQLSKFIGYDDNGMEDGDIVIAYAPSKGTISGIGRVKDVEYDENLVWEYLTEEEAEEHLVDDHYYTRPINWFDLGTPIAVNDLSKEYQVQGSHQIPTPPTLNRYGSLKEDSDRIEGLIDEIVKAETVDRTRGEFGPEKEAQIQNWIIDNIREFSRYNPRKEVKTSVGRIDVLADSNNGETVFEVKYGRAGDQALGQLLGYMGARAEKVDEEIDGMLVAEEFTNRIQKATSRLENVELYQFQVST